MDTTHPRYQECLALLREELIPVTGCTEPGTLAYAAATARNALGRFPETCEVSLSGNLVKNVRSVAIAGTGGLVGIEAAVVAGLVSGRTDLKTNLLASLTGDQARLVREQVGQGMVLVRRLATQDPLHLVLKASAANHAVVVELRGTHDRIVRIELDGRVVFRDAEATVLPSGPAVERCGLRIADILAFSRTVDLSLVEPVLAPQIDLNMAISDAGMGGGWGVGVGLALWDPVDPLSQVKARTAAASEARMCGCPLPVVTNSGSGNQGIAASVPVVTYARHQGADEEALRRALVLSNLLTIYQKRFIGRLSGFCGVISATCAAGAGIAFLNGATDGQISLSVTNTLANTPGVICDGAKASCGAKIAAGLDAAWLGQKLALGNRGYVAGDGILQADADATIAAVGRLAREGMRETDACILGIMEG